MSRTQAIGGPTTIELSPRAKTRRRKAQRRAAKSTTVTREQYQAGHRPT